MISQDVCMIALQDVKRFRMESYDVLRFQLMSHDVIRLCLIMSLDFKWLHMMSYVRVFHEFIGFHKISIDSVWCVVGLRWISNDFLLFVSFLFQISYDVVWWFMISCEFVKWFRMSLRYVACLLWLCFA